jgi:hypothetical protein
MAGRKRTAVSGSDTEAETIVVDDTERLIQVTVSQEHYNLLKVRAAERGSSVAVVAKQVFAEAMGERAAAVPKETN